MALRPMAIAMAIIASAPLSAAPAPGPASIAEHQRQCAGKDGWSDPAPSQWLAWVEVLLCLVLFTACTLHVRLRQRNAREAAAQAEAQAAQQPATAAAPGAGPAV